MGKPENTWLKLPKLIKITTYRKGEINLFKGSSRAEPGANPTRTTFKHPVSALLAVFSSQSLFLPINSFTAQGISGEPRSLLSRFITMTILQVLCFFRIKSPGKAFGHVWAGRDLLNFCKHLIRFLCNKPQNFQGNCWQVGERYPGYM